MSTARGESSPRSAWHQPERSHSLAFAISKSEIGLQDHHSVAFPVRFKLRRKKRYSWNSLYITNRIRALGESIFTDMLPHMRTTISLILAILFFRTAAARGQAERPLHRRGTDLNCAIGPYGDQAAVTPNLDRLAARGITYQRAYCQQAVCNPSRSSFLTGLRPDTVGVDDLKKIFSGHSTTWQHFNYPPPALQKPRLFLSGTSARSFTIWATQKTEDPGRSTKCFSKAPTLRIPSIVTLRLQRREPIRRRSPKPTMYRTQPTATAKIANLTAAMLRDHAESEQPFFSRGRLSGVLTCRLSAPKKILGTYMTRRPFPMPATQGPTGRRAPDSLV